MTQFWHLFPNLTPENSSSRIQLGYRLLTENQDHFDATAFVQDLPRLCRIGDENDEASTRRYGKLLLTAMALQQQNPIAGQRMLDFLLTDPTGKPKNFLTPQNQAARLRYFVAEMANNKVISMFKRDTMRQLLLTIQAHLDQSQSRVFFNVLCDTKEAGWEPHHHQYNKLLMLVRDMEGKSAEVQTLKKAMLPRLLSRSFLEYFHPDLL